MCHIPQDFLWLMLKWNQCGPQPGILPLEEEGCGTSLSPHAILDLLTPSSPVQVWLTRRELILLVFIHPKPSPFEWWSQHLTSSMASKKGCMYSYLWSSSIAGTLGFCGEQPSHASMGYGNGSRWPVITWPTIILSWPMPMLLQNIISSTCTTVEHSASNRVLSCSCPTFCSIITQARGHNPSKGFDQEC